MSMCNFLKLEKEVRGMLLVESALSLLGEIGTWAASCGVLITDLREIILPWSRCLVLVCDVWESEQVVLA